MQFQQGSKLNSIEGFVERLQINFWFLVRYDQKISIPQVNWVILPLLSIKQVVSDPCIDGRYR